MSCQNPEVISRTILLNLDLEMLENSVKRDRFCLNVKFLNAERTPIFAFVLIQIFIFVLPFFAAVPLFIDNISVIHDDYGIHDPFGPRKEEAILRVLILLTICVMSFVEMFALRSVMFVAYVCTEAIVWLGYLSGSMDFNDIDIADVELTGPTMLLTFTIVVKFMLAYVLRKLCDDDLKAKAFLKDNGKNV